MTQKLKVVLVLLAAILVFQPPVFALTSSDIQSLIEEHPYYDPSSSIGGGSCSTSTTSVPAGNLPALIPEPYNGAFTQGANNHKVAPALVAALFSEENALGGNTQSPSTSNLPLAWASFVKNHPDPNSGWPTSSAGAEGPFQFLPSTWTGLGYDISLINNLVTASDAAAKDMANNGAAAGAPESTWRTAIFDYNHADWYVNAVLKYYDYYNSQPGTNQIGGSTTVTSSSCPSNVVCSSSNSSPQGLSQTRTTVVCLAKQELQKWTSGQLSAATGFLTYSQQNYEEWCADFVSWLYDQSGYPLQPDPDWRINSVSAIQTIGQQNQKFHFHSSDGSYTPKPGDLAIHGTGHVNMVVGISGTQVTLIGGDEGNGPYGTQFPPSQSIVQQDIASGYSDLGITGYVSPD